MGKQHRHPKSGRWVCTKDALQSSRRSHDAWLNDVRKQVDFYFSDANLRRGGLVSQKLAEGDGYLELSTILDFPRIKAQGCLLMDQLVEAIKLSSMLLLSDDQTQVTRNLAKIPIQDYDPTPRQIYVEGLPLTYGLDALVEFFARYGTIRIIDLPNHADTKELRGFCFVEYASLEEAVNARTSLDGHWPSRWPARYDGRVLRVLSKQKWLECKRTYYALKRTSRGTHPGSGSYHVQLAGRPSGTPTEILSIPSLPRFTRSSSEHMCEAIEKCDERVLPPVQIAGHTRSFTGNVHPATTTTIASSVDEIKRHMLDTSNARRDTSDARIHEHGCLLRLTGFSQPQSPISIRQFAEHAVPVEYCSYKPGASEAVLRLVSAQDVAILLEELRITGRKLGWLMPKVHQLDATEETEYWCEVKQNRAARDAMSPQTKPQQSSKRARRWLVGCPKVS